MTPEEPNKPDQMNEEPPRPSVSDVVDSAADYAPSNPNQQATTQVQSIYIEGEKTFSNIVSHLLKKPLNVIHTIHDKGGVSYTPMLVMTVLSLSLFGFILGSFDGVSHQMWAAPVKIVFGLLFSSLLCLPSLYIFCCVGGLDLKFSTIFGIQVCTMAITSLLLIGFSPVVWLFSSSSNSIVFFGFLTLLFWFICLCMGLKFLIKAGKSFGMKHPSHLYLWAFIFTLVTFQMPTTLRPIIQDGPFLQLDEKKFFLQHWVEGDKPKSSGYQKTSVSEKPQRTNSSRTRGY